MANATMQALQTHAEKLNKQVAEVNASIKALGDVPDDSPALQEYRKQLRRLNSDLKDVNTTMKDYTRGVKAAGELYRHYAMGNIEDMSIKAIRAGVNGMKKRLDNLKAGGDPGDAEEMRLIEAITTEADVVVKRFKTDYQHVVEEIARGGTVTEQTLKRTRDGLADLMQTAETEAEKNELTNYWQKVGAAIEAVAVENRRLRGEVADREEAMRIAYATDHDGSQQAIHDAEARADAARRENDELRQRLDLKQQQRRELEQEMDINSMQVRSLMDRRDELKAQEKEDRAIRNQRVDDANKELNAARSAAKTQQQAYDEQKQTVEKLRTEVQGLTDDIRKMGEVKAEPKIDTSDIEGLKKKIESTIDELGTLEQQWDDKIADYIFEKYPTQATVSAKTKSPEGLKEREAMKKDTVLAQMQKQREQELNAVDERLTSLIRKEREWTEAQQQSTTAQQQSAQSSEQLAQKQEQLSQKTAELNQQQDKLNGMVDETVTANQRLAKAEQEQTDARNAQAEAKKHEGEAVKKVEDELRGLTDEQLKNGQAYSHLTEEINADTAAMQRNITTEQEATREADRLRSGSIDKMEQALARLRESNRKLDPTIDKEGWERGERAIGQLNLRLEELKKQSAELRREPVLDMMTQRMDQLGTLSRDALTETKKFWETMAAGAEKGSGELAEYEQHLKSIALEEQARVREQGREAFAFFQREDYRRTTAANTEEQRKTLVAYRDTIPVSDTRRIEEINALLEKQAQFVKEAAGEWMSLEKAMELASKAGTDQFAGSAKDIQLATQSLERQRDTIIATIREKRNLGQVTKAEEDQLADLTKKLRSLKFEQDNVNMSQEKMRTLIETPANAVNLDELRAAIKRADGQLRQMQQSLGENSDEYKRFAEQVRNAKNVMKEMEGQSKESATAWEKAFNRLKTYVVMYMGFNEVWQKVTGTARDLMDLSDRMGEVRKTTGFTADEVGRLSDNLVKLDTRTSLTALMDISAKAGQLGLKTLEDVQGFTQAANMLMVALPEMGQEAATEMMKVALATGEVKKIQKQMNEGLVDGTNAVSVALTKVGSTIDQLRANSAASAPAITDFVKRVGAVGAQSGISIDQVAALGATVDALGMRVEMSATALSRMIPAIKNNAFAIGKAIGVTQTWIEEQFAAGNAMEVILKIFDHIRDTNMNAAEIESAFGSSMQDIMKELNQQGARAGIVFAGLSQGVDELRANLGIASEAYEENIAITNEYLKMNETAAAKWERLKNQIEETFVGDNAQRGLSVLIDMLRSLVDFITGNVNPALHGLSILTRTFIAYVAMLKIGLGEGLFVSSISGLKEMGSNLMKLIHPSKEYLNLTKALTAAKAAEAAATTEAEMAKAAETVRTLEAKVAQEGLNKAQRANIYAAIAVAAFYAATMIYRWATSVDKATSSLAKAKEEASNAVARFEGYYATMNKTSVSLQKAQREHSKLSSEVEKLRNSTDKSSEATAKLKDKEDKLKISENNLTTAKEKHRTSIAEMNKIYGKYLGFLLTEENYANMAALAHNRVADAIEREMLMKQQQAAIEKIRNDNQEEQQKGRGSFYQSLIKKGGLSSTQASQADKALSEMLRSKVRYDSKNDKFLFNKSVYEYLKKHGVNASGASAEQVAALWMNAYLKDNYHIDPYSLNRITGVGIHNGKDGWSTVRTGFFSNLRANYLSTYFNTKKQEGDVEQTFKPDIEVRDESLRKNSQGLINKLLSDSNKAVNTIKKKGKAADTNKAYGNLANSIEGLEQQMLSLDPNKDAQLIVKINQTIDNIRRNTDATRLKKAQERIHASLFEQATWNGNETITDLASVGGGSTPNPYGSYNMMDSYDKWDADALVARKKQMLEFVKKLGDGADVQAVLKQDEKFIDEATRKGIKNVRDAIEWYNSERLKIQQELDSRHLTNEGNWENTRKAKERKKKSKQVYSEEAVAELDRYYAWRKEELERQRTEEGVSEAEYNRRVELMEQEHLKKRSDLRRTFTHNETKEEKAAVERFWNWWKSIKELDQDIANEGRVLINSEWKVATARDKAYNDRYAQEDLTSMQAIVVKQMKAIEDIIAKERPYDGITENLEKNLTTMGILFADFDKRRKEALERGASQNEIQEIERLSGAERFKRLGFMLQEAEHAYMLTWDDLKERMQKAGFGDLVDAIASNENGERMQQALIAQLHTVYDQVQDAIKKESSLIKKQTENLWNDLLPDGSGMSLKDSYEKAISDLGLQEDQVKRANSLIGAGAASERVADRLAIKQMELRLAMQQTYYALMQQEGLKRIAFLKEEQRMEEAKAKRHEAEARRLRQQGKEQEAIREETAAEDAMHRSIQARLDAEHASTSLQLAKTKELAEEEKQRVAIQNQLEERQNRLYKLLREWADLLTSSLQGVMEASHAGDAEYYNERAKLNLTGKGGPGAGTYVVIDDAGTSGAKAHYEYLDEREALERQHEIERENAQAEAWKKLMDDLNMKMSETITDQLNAMFQTASLDANTQAVLANTEAIYKSMGVESGESAPGQPDAQPHSIQDDNDPSTWPRARRKRAGLPVDENPHDYTQGVVQTPSSTTTGGTTAAPATDGEMPAWKPGYMMTDEERDKNLENMSIMFQNYRDMSVQAETEKAEMLAEIPGYTKPVISTTEEDVERVGEISQQLADKQMAADNQVTDNKIQNDKRKAQSETQTDKTMTQSSKNMYAAMTAAANMYGIAYQTMANDNLSTTQKVQMFILQAVGQAAMSALTVSLAKANGETATSTAAGNAKTYEEAGPYAAPIIIAVMTALLGGMLGLAASKIGKAKSEISQVTGASVGAGRLATGMLTYAEGNVNELTDPASLTPGRQYNVDGADGKTYRARYMGKGAKTHITNGPEFHLVGEAGREAIIDAKTTRLLQMNETGIWRDIQTLYNGGSISGLSTRRRRGGVRAFADGNIGEFEDMADGGGLTAEGTGGMGMEQMLTALDRNSAVQEALLERLSHPIVARNIWTGPEGIPNMVNKMQKEAQRHGEKYM